MDDTCRHFGPNSSALGSYICRFCPTNPSALGSNIWRVMPGSLETSQNTGAVTVSKGALNFAVELSYNDTVSAGRRSDQALSDVERIYPNAPAAYLEPFDNHTQDHTLLPTTDWRIAIDPTSIQVNNTTDHLPYHVWAPDANTLTMTAQACAINWEIVNSTASEPPKSPNVCTSDKFDVRLVPFGEAKLRLGEIPTMTTT